jgi:hypothetical protein
MLDLHQQLAGAKTRDVKIAYQRQIDATGRPAFPVDASVVNDADRIARASYSVFFSTASGFAPSSGASCVVGLGFGGSW